MADKPQEKKEFKKKDFKGAPGKPGASKAPIKEENENFRGIVRIAGKDMDGHYPLYRALLRVKGIGQTLARTLARVLYKGLNLNSKTRVGDLSDEQIEKIDEILKTPEKHGVPWFQLNRARDADMGFSRHVMMADLQFSTRQDMQRGKDMRTWKGWRHSIGQRVRGQHSRTTGRSGMTMGVLRKAVQAQKAAGAGAGAPAEEKKK